MAGHGHTETHTHRHTHRHTHTDKQTEYNKAIRDGKYLARHSQTSFWDTPLNCYMLNVAHVTNDVKWRPIVTTFGTLIENMSRTGLYDLTILWAILTAVLEFYMLNVKYCRIFVTSFLCSLKFLLFQLIGHTKRCLQKNIEHFLWLSFCDMTVPSKSNVPSLWPWPLTYERQFSKYGYRPLHVKRRTRQKWR